MSFTLPPLPYADDALAPHISAETISFHYGKHHASYVAKLNGLVEGTAFADKSLEEIVTTSEGGMFNNAAQIWNHTFYWNGLSPQGGGEASGDISDAIKSTWGSFADFKDAMSAAAAGNFGSGWTWLVQNKSGDLEIVNTSNAGCPLTDGLTPILTIDVWEHAYYVDYRNARPQYIEAFWALVNWDFANANFSA